MNYRKIWAQMRFQATTLLPLYVSVYQKIHKFLGQWRRYAKGLSAWVATCVTLAVIYIIVTPPEYSASTLVILEPRRPFSSSPLSESLPASNLDSSQVESQIQIVKSEQVLKFVFKELNLQSDPEYIAAPSGLARLQTSIFGGGQLNMSNDRKESIAFPAFADKVSVRRIGLSLVLEIGFRSRSAARAASIANSITAAFIRDQIESKSLSMRRTGEWLQGKIDDIKEQRDASIEAVRKGNVPSMQFSASDARIISSASEPLVKSFPQTGLIVTMALAFALLSGLGAISIYHSFDRRIQTKKQIADELDLECLASIPLIKDESTFKNTRDYLSYSVSEKGAYSDFAEGLRALRAFIFSVESTKPKPHKIGIISYISNEGKTTISANISYLIAKAGRKTLLIDMDLKNSTLTTGLSINSDYNIANILKTKTVHNPGSGTELANSLSFIPATSKSITADPNIFVDEKILQKLFENYKDQDYIILDLPAMSISADVNAVSLVLDAVILIAEAGRTTLPDIKEMIEQLQRSNVAIMGIVLNKTDV